MNIEEAIGDLKYYIGEDPYFNGTYEPVTDFEKYCYNHCKAIDKVLNELDKKDALIDIMVEWINKQDIDEEICKNNITQPELCNEEGTNCRDCIKEYFYKKAQK